MPTDQTTSVFSSDNWRKLVGVELALPSKVIILLSAPLAIYARVARIVGFGRALGTLLFLSAVPASAASLSIPDATEWVTKVAFVALFGILFWGLARKAKRL